MDQGACARARGRARAAPDSTVSCTMLARAARAARCATPQSVAPDSAVGCAEAVHGHGGRSPRAAASARRSARRARARAREGRALAPRLRRRWPGPRPAGDERAPDASWGARRAPPGAPSPAPGASLRPCGREARAISEAVVRCSTLHEPGMSRGFSPGFLVEAGPLGSTCVSCKLTELVSVIRFNLHLVLVSKHAGLICLGACSFFLFLFHFGSFGVKSSHEHLVAPCRRNRFSSRSKAWNPVSQVFVVCVSE